MAGKILIGCQPQYYARVLIYALGVEGPRHKVVFAPPAELAAGLAADELDVALISSIDYFRRPGLVILPDISVSARGPAGCGLLVARTGMGNLRRVGVDPRHPALAALAAVILHKSFDLRPRWVAATPEQALADKGIDAWVAGAEMGLPAAPEGLQVFDLGELWWKLAQLPFVYALWAAGAGARLEGLDKDLLVAKREGLRRAAEVAEVDARRLGVDPHQCYKSIMSFRYDLSNVERGGLEAFYRYAVLAHLVHDGVTVAIYRG